MSVQDLRWKICNYGYDFFLRTERLSRSFDPELGTPQDWKNRVLQDRTWGDEVFLWQVASNILQVDLIIIPCFRESSVHQGLGFTLIKSFERPKHLPLYLFSFWNLTLTRHITSVYYQTIIVTITDRTSLFQKRSNDNGLIIIINIIQDQTGVLFPRVTKSVLA